MPTENSVITREHLPGLLLARTIWENGGPSLYFPPALQDATDQARAALPAPVSVPDGYMPIPTAEQLADALESVRCFHDLGAELIAPELLANLLAATTVKAEQVQCEVCHGQGEVYSGHDQHFHYFDFQPPEPIMEVCPECGGEEAPSLPTAGSADLTAVRCQCCATEYPHDSYDAGFIAGSGMCQVCDAAIPAVDLPSAAPAEQPYPHGIAEDLERSDWAPLEALQWYAAGKHFDVADGRTRIIDTGAVASNALKHASLAYLELKGDAELSELRAALSAQQSDPWAPSDADYDHAIHRNPDARAWADFFVATFPGQADKHDLMIVWFANAMMAMHDHLKAQQPEFCCEHSYKVAKQAAWGALDLTQCKCDHNEYCEHCWPDDFREGGKWHGGFETKQSVRASVPREWLDAVKELFDAKQAKEDFERENPGNSTKRWDACLYRIEAAEDALRALLNGGEA